MPQAKAINARPARVDYPTNDIPVRHYGKIVFGLFEKLKTMEPGKERDVLTRLTANQMKRDIMQWSHGFSSEEKVADDLARYTDGKIQLDLSTFKFDKIDLREVEKKRKKR